MGPPLKIAPGRGVTCRAAGEAKDRVAWFSGTLAVAATSEVTVRVGEHVTRNTFGGVRVYPLAQLA